MSVLNDVLFSTGEAICSANPSLDNLELLEVLRERCFGDLEGKPYEAMVEALKVSFGCLGIPLFICFYF